MVIGVCEAYEQSYSSSLKWWLTHIHTYTHTPFPLIDSAHPVGWAEWKNIKSKMMIKHYLFHQFNSNVWIWGGNNYPQYKDIYLGEWPLELICAEVQRSCNKNLKKLLGLLWNGLIRAKKVWLCVRLYFCCLSCICGFYSPLILFLIFICANKQGARGWQKTQRLPAARDSHRG